ncbi:nadh-dependent dehydrogenase : NADH-dependent dehydrogenase OS=uncultured planctomycete GN=HGMM_F22C11C05 PE=4 SV=1: GFO_IDH_MocA [Gemmata massiliana]|uniref:Gfo/Idh/MocA-like oxidoreductase N-terminal domain-containing protein n=1 Tax=Gemmata massiliana TaxID=1210884 RepID=A0A6P2CY76_9BACT|nr:Gfo/Idh/MocA family oxidoreductase [Gemmata massiliana]VTR93853.1 nadh-dependent dehydrogenase : NADH-dependent dehydrogenase OS=uncultured planctomycete GN=HGMM_F22C11C05 PE=4 SV=1: GFO_IDH_MocA [Gemmata massiliana]
MTRVSRRRFLQTSLATAATVTIAGTKSSARVMGANDRIRIAVAGLNGRGESHVGAYLGMKNVEIAYLVDPDKRTYQKRLDQIARKERPAAPCIQDVRKALEDKDLNAVSIATPNHWHALMTIWACEAGKDVYVEKPCSHNIHEGRIAVEMARKHKRVVQHGTQNRSSQGWADLAALAKSGKLGKLLVSRGLCYKDGGTGGSTRGDIGTKPTKAPPADLDFNIWLGPAQEQPYHENLVHYRWHWFWAFGNGDAGNQGVHEMDKARWLIPGATWPKSVISFGGRYANNDQAETPNALVSVFDYGETQLIFETRGLKSPAFRGQTVGNILHFEEGVVAGAKFYPKGKDEGQPIPKVVSDVKLGGDHFTNFIDCVRSRDTAKLHADIEVGHVSAGLCHLGNISYRLGKASSYEPKLGKIAGNESGTDALERMAEHLKDSGIKFDGQNFFAGRKLDFDAKTETFSKDSEANALLTRKYRAPFTVPDKV